ncbi:hypothetical protein LAT59_00805 [Candidatus Gracilibacteria bacterium]|nr:hypothetical protein [Candidatus Gracilibacteria bacterium]
MIEFLKELNQNYSNIITALATVIYMGFTGWLILETRKTRIMQEKPHIEIFVKRNEGWGSMLDLVIKNIGYSGAYNLKFEIDKNFNLLDNDEKDIYKLDNLGFFKNGIKFLPANGEISNLFTILSTNYAEKIKWKINISCCYNDKYGKKVKDSFLIDLSMFEDTFLPQEKPIYKIEKHLSKIEKNFHKLSTGFNIMRIITQTKKEYQEEQEENFKRFNS